MSGKASSKLIVLAGLCAYTLMGCVSVPLEGRWVRGPRIGDNSDVLRIPANDEGAPFMVQDVRGDDGQRQFTWKGDNTAIEQEGPCRLPLHRRYYRHNHFLVVKGEISGGRQCPVILDTGGKQMGASTYGLLNGSHIIENNLPVFPWRNSVGQSNGGFTYIPGLRLGNVSLNNLPCWYREQSMQFCLFGIPLYTDKAIVLGLRFLREFKYLGYDGENREALVSHLDSFAPSDPLQWDQYSCAVEQDEEGDPILVAEVRIAGIPMRVRVDTGSGTGLVVDRQSWEMLHDQVDMVSRKDSTSFFPLSGGKLPCVKVRVRGLPVGRITVDQATVRVVSDDTLEKLGGLPLLGTQFFRNGIIVVDFEHNLLWVKP